MIPVQGKAAKNVIDTHGGENKKKTTPSSARPLQLHVVAWRDSKGMNDKRKFPAQIEVIGSLQVSGTFLWKLGAEWNCSLSCAR